MAVFALQDNQLLVKQLLALAPSRDMGGQACLHYILRVLQPTRDVEAKS